MNHRERIYFLINPRSGGKNSFQIIRNLKEISLQHDFEIVVEELNPEIIANQIAKAHQAETVVVGGGDGTISYFLNELKQHPRIGLLPLGTGNDLARELGLAALINLNDPHRIIEFYRSNKTCELTLGCLEYGEGFSKQTHFTNYVSFGFDAKVVADFARWREKKTSSYFRGVWSNRLAYAVACLANLNYQLPKISPIINTGSGEQHLIKQDKSIIFANIRSVMGMGKSNLTSSAFDQEIEALIVKNIMGYGSMLVNHSVSFFHPKFLGSSTGWSLMQVPTGIHIQLDGEPRPDIISTNFRVCAGKKVNLIIAGET